MKGVESMSAARENVGDDVDNAERTPNHRHGSSALKSQSETSIFLPSPGRPDPGPTDSTSSVGFFDLTIALQVASEDQYVPHPGIQRALSPTAILAFLNPQPKAARGGMASPAGHTVGGATKPRESMTRGSVTDLHNCAQIIQEHKCISQQTIKCMREVATSVPQPYASFVIGCK